MDRIWNRLSQRSRRDAKKEASRWRELEIIINNASFGRLIRLRRNRIASRKGFFFSFILLERSSILLPSCPAVALGRSRKASSEALFDLISVLIRACLRAPHRQVIRGLEQNSQKLTILISKSLCSLWPLWFVYLEVLRGEEAPLARGEGKFNMDRQDGQDLE